MRRRISFQSCASGVGPPRTGVDGDDRVPGVVLPAEERLLLEPVELAAQGEHALLDLVQLAVLVGEQEQLLEVARLPAQAVVHLQPAREPGVLGGRPRRNLLVVPEPRRAHRLLEQRQPRPQAVRSKVITDPGKLGPDLSELSLDRAPFGHGVDGIAPAARHRAAVGVRR
jgi:hypothetical protein